MRKFDGLWLVFDGAMIHLAAILDGRPPLVRQKVLDHCLRLEELPEAFARAEGDGSTVDEDG